MAWYELHSGSTEHQSFIANKFGIRIGTDVRQSKDGRTNVIGGIKKVNGSNITFRVIHTKIGKTDGNSTPVAILRVTASEAGKKFLKQLHQEYGEPAHEVERTIGDQKVIESYHFHGATPEEMEVLKKLTEALLSKIDQKPKNK